MSQKKRIFLRDAFFSFGLLSGCFLDYCQLASVITALTAYCVIDVPCSAVRADCKCRCYCLIVSPSFRSSCLGLPSFRMCHFVLFLLLLFIRYLIPSSCSEHPNGDHLLLNPQLRLPHLLQLNARQASPSCPCYTCRVHERA